MVQAPGGPRAAPPPPPARPPAPPRPPAPAANNNNAPRAPARSESPAQRRQALDRIGNAERQVTEATRSGNQTRAREAQTRIQTEARGLYGHLYTQPSRGRAAPSDPALTRRFLDANAADRDRMLAEMPATERDRLAADLRAERDRQDRRIQEFLRGPSDRDPRVQEARREYERLNQEQQRAWREYNDARQQIYERERSISNRIARVFGRDRPDEIADRETRDQRTAAQDAYQRARQAEARLRELERTPQLTPAEQRERAALQAERDRLDRALNRVGLGVASRADAESWLRASPEARNLSLAYGAVDRERADSLNRHLEAMQRDLSRAPPGETPEARTAREARLREIEAARHRLQHIQDAPQIYEARAQADRRIAELEAARRTRRLTPAEQRELEDHRVVLTGADRLTPENNMLEWSRWERDLNRTREQEALRREWQEHVARNPEAQRALDEQVRQARERALAQLPADQRAAFERAFAIETRFLRDAEGNLNYQVGYAPRPETILEQTRQSLALGLHMSQPAMEIPRYYRTEEYARPGTPAEAILWHNALGDRRPSELMTRWSGGGLRDASMDFLWITPAGAIRNAGRYTLGQFFRAAGSELATNAAFGTAIHMAGNAVSERFGERYGAMVPVAALLGTLVTGRVVASPRVQAAARAVGNRAAQILGRTPAPLTLGREAPLAEALIQRLPGYQARDNATFGRLMAEATEQLQGAIARGEVRTAEDAIRFMGRRVNEVARASGRRDVAMGQTLDDFGRMREPGQDLLTNINGHYAGYRSAADDFVGQDGFRIMTQDGVQLTGTMAFPGATGRWFHTSPEQFPQVLERMEQAWQRALTAKTDDEVIRAVAELHWWGANMVPYVRGSAGGIDAITKAVLRQRGINPGRWREGVGVDLEAFNTPLEEFVRRYPTFFE